MAITAANVKMILFMNRLFSVIAVFNMSSTRTRRDAACHVSCQSGVAFPSFPAAKLRQKAESRCIHKRAKPTIFTEIAAPAIREGRETRVNFFPARIWDKNRAAIPSQRSFGTRIAPRYLPSEDLGQESRRDTFPAKFWDKNRAAIPSQRSFGTRIWDKNRAAIPSQRSFGTRIAPRYLPSEVLGQESRDSQHFFADGHPPSSDFSYIRV